MTKKMPKFYRWGGGVVPLRWSFGYDCRTIDLVCVKPDVQVDIEGEIALSPVCSTRLLALIGFILKKVVLKVDQNSKGGIMAEHTIILDEDEDEDD